MNRPVIARQVESDLDEIADYIGKDNPERALSFVREIRSRFAQIVERPHSFPIHEEWRAELRSAIHGRYHIVFTVIGDTVHIIRVIHGARDIDAMFGQY
jgi:toxin ParE1/3/4